MQSNEDAILNAYKKNGENAGLRGITISVKDNSGYLDSFRGGEIVFCPSPPHHSAIEIKVKAKDKKRFNNYEFDWEYFSKDQVEMVYRDFSDYQTKKGIFYLKPQNSIYTLFFDVRTKY